MFISNLYIYIYTYVLLFPQVILLFFYGFLLGTQAVVSRRFLKKQADRLHVSPRRSPAGRIQSGVMEMPIAMMKLKGIAMDQQKAWSTEPNSPLKSVKLSSLKNEKWGGFFVLKPTFLEFEVVFNIVEYSGVNFQKSFCQVISSNFTQVFEISSLSWLSCHGNIVFSQPKVPVQCQSFSWLWATVLRKHRRDR